MSSLLFMLLTTISFLSEKQWVLFYAKEITGSAVEADTLKPVEGAIVVGMWQLSQILGEGYGGYAQVVETKTDKNGEFTISSWIKFMPWKFYTLTHDNAPMIMIYKPGYRVQYSSQAKVKITYPQVMTDEELKKSIENRSINPAKLKRVSKDDERMQNYRDWVTKARFPGNQFSRGQAEEIFTALEEDLSQLSNSSRDRDILAGIQGLRKFWGGKQ